MNKILVLLGLLLACCNDPVSINRTYAYQETEPSCYRPYVVRVSIGKWQGAYYCRYVSRQKGDDCLEAGWWYWKTDAKPDLDYKSHDWREVFWDGAVVEIRRAIAENC